MTDTSPLQLPALNGSTATLEETNEKVMALVQTATEEAERTKETTITVWRYSVGYDVIGQAILVAFITFGLYVTLHSTYNFVNTYIGELFGGLGAVPVAAFSDASILAWSFLLTHHANNLVRLFISGMMLCVATIAVGSILVGEIVARDWLTSYTAIFTLLLTLSIYGSTLAGMVYLFASVHTYAKIRHIFTYGYAPDIRIEELRKLVQNTAQVTTEENATPRKAEVVKNLLKSGSLDDAIIEYRKKDMTVPAIVAALGLEEKQKRDVDRVIARLKKESKL